MIATKSKIVFTTFLNDYSGSPKMLSIIAAEFIAKGYDVEIITNGDDGHLSGIAGAKYNYVHYRLGEKNILNFIYFAIAQIELFFKILSKDKDTLIYINTITPIGAAWACLLSGKKYIYHVHEDMTLKKPIYKIYKLTYRICNKKTIFVSNYLKNISVKCRNGIVIYNCLDNNFTRLATSNRETDIHKRKNILLVSSLRKYKGVYAFVQLAKELPEYNFEMVVSANKDETQEFVNEVVPPKNLEIHSVKPSLHQHYRSAKLLLSLTDPKYWVETFGLTILEAMAYGVPSIVPNVGGPLELVKDGVNGFCVNPVDIMAVKERIYLLMNDDALYSFQASNAYEFSKSYSCDKMIQEVENYIFKK